MGCTPPQPSKKNNIPYPEPPNLNFDYHPEQQTDQQHSEQGTFSQFIGQSSSQSLCESLKKSEQFSSRNSIQYQSQRDLPLNSSLYSILIVNEDINSRENYCQFYKYLDLSQDGDIFPVSLIQTRPKVSHKLKYPKKKMMTINLNQDPQDHNWFRYLKRSLEDSDFLFLDPPAQVVKLNTHNQRVLELIKRFKPYERKEQFERTDLPFVVLSNGIMTYYGQIENDLKTGFGRALFRDGAYFEGYWLKDKPNFHGRLIHGDGHMYEGEWSFGKAEGYGSFYKDGELKFKGHFKNDLPNRK